MRRLGAARVLFGHYYSLFGLRALPLLTCRLLRRNSNSKRIVQVSWGRRREVRRYSGEALATQVNIGGARESEAAWFATRFPDVVEQKAAAAEHICRHEFDFLGTGASNWGEPIDWRIDVKSGHRWPLKFYTDYCEDELMPGNGVDVKIPWELSRLHHFVTLGQAWWLTGERRYADEFFAQWESWLEANPWPYGVNWTSAMEAAIRAVNLIWATSLLAEAPGWTEERRKKLANSLWQHGVYIEHNLEVGVCDGHVGATNHYLANVCALACLGLCWLELPDEARWRKIGLKALEQEMQRQVLPDGFFFESSTSYHRLAVELFLIPALLARRCGYEISQHYWERLEQMLDLILHLTRPDGCVPQIGDNDDGRLLILSQYPDWPRHDHRYLLALGAVLFKRGDFKAAAGECPEDVFWLLGREAIEQFDALEPDPTPLGSRAFPYAGLYVIRSQDNRDYALVRTSTQPSSTFSFSPSQLPTAHAHNDMLSPELWVDGQPVFIDPGTYCYTSDLEARNRFRSSAAHNTVTVDEEEINRIPPDDPFRLERDTQVRVIDWQVGEEAVRLVAEHVGYSRLNPPVVHRRTICYRLKERVWELEDHLMGGGNHQVALRWHLAPGVRVTRESGNSLLTRKVQVEWIGQVDTRLEAGTVALGYGRAVEAPVLVLRWKGKGPVRIRCTPSVGVQR